MNHTPLFSVLIANHNNGRYISECIESVIRQSFQHWEIVIVDDSSDDESLKVIREYLNRGVTIHLHVNDKNRGCGYTKRKCVELAKGEICGFLDADDALDSNALQKHVDMHLENPNCAIVYSLNFNCNENLEILHKTGWGGKLPHNESQLTAKPGNKITAFATFRSELYKKTEGINPAYRRAVDQDLYYKLEEAGPVCFLNEYLYYYRTHPRNISMNQNNLKAQYWHYIADCDAYKRRKKNKFSIKNITYGELQRAYLNICISKIDEKVREKSLKKLIYYYFQCMIRIVWDKDLLFFKMHYRLGKHLLKR